MEEKQGRNHGFNVGGSERCRREPSQGAKGGEVWGGGVPLQIRKGVWGGGRAAFPEIFLIFYLKMVSFGAFCVALPRAM